jgi:pimeloyl-ACP methyl ester carboxylesterase
MTKRQVEGLEVLSCASKNKSTQTETVPLLFLHGALADAWVWDEHFLPSFAAQGYDAHALSFRGHGTSYRLESLNAHACTTTFGAWRDAGERLAAGRRDDSRLAGGAVNLNDFKPRY